MVKNSHSRFSLMINSFLSFRDEFKINVIDGVWIVSLTDCIQNECLFERTLTDAELESFEDCLAKGDVKNWLREYSDPEVYDGLQWGMRYRRRGYSGSNAYPNGFSILGNYLADNFGCERFRCGE